MNTHTETFAVTLPQVPAEKRRLDLMPPTEEITLSGEKLKQGKSGSTGGNEARLDQAAGLYSSHQSSAPDRGRDSARFHAAAVALSLLIEP